MGKLAEVTESDQVKSSAETRSQSWAKSKQSKVRIRGQIDTKMRTKINEKRGQNKGKNGVKIRSENGQKSRSEEEGKISAKIEEVLVKKHLCTTLKKRAVL